MKITTIPFADTCINQSFEGKIVVVIDVLRATSTMITALMHGAKQIIPVVEIEEAVALKQSFPPSEVLLCGERSAGIIPGFDLGNSPFEYAREKVQGKTLIMSTTNGTKAIRLALAAKEIILASFINATAVARYLQNKTDVILFCSGTNGNFSMDDALCAGFLAHQIEKQKSIEPCDLTQTVLYNYGGNADELNAVVKNCVHGKLLMQKGYENDIDYCLKTQVTEVIPIYDFITGAIKPITLQHFDY